LREVAENSQSDAARVAAANALLDRGYGRPPQAPPIIEDDDDSIHMEDVDMRNLAKFVLDILRKTADKEREKQERRLQIDGAVIVDGDAD